MFCGWRLMGSKPTLVELGSGVLEIDSLTRQCHFHSQPIVQLAIAKELVGWMQQDLATNKIPIATLNHARLTVKLTFNRVPWNEKTKEIFYSDNMAVRTQEMCPCTFDCDSEVATPVAAYRSKLNEVQECPVCPTTAI
jgi:hypothetical protein